MPEDSSAAGAEVLGDLDQASAGSPLGKRSVVDMVNLAQPNTLGKDQALLNEDGEAGTENAQDGGINDGAMAVEMWYWNTANEFKSEVMFCNPVDSDTPKLIIPLEVFDKMKKVYNEKTRLLHSRKNQFDELLTLFRTMRRQYYHDLQGLRDLLKTAREAQELRENGGYLDPRKQARMARMESVVMNREVHYFNVLDVVDPEFKEILIAECRQFHKELILENAALADQLAALGIGTLTLEEKLRMFIAEFELSEIVNQLAKFAPGDTAPQSVRRRYLLSLFNAAGIEEQFADEIIAKYIDKTAGSDAPKDPTESEEYKSLKEKYDELDERRGDLMAELDDLRAQVSEISDIKDAEMSDLRMECDRLRSEALSAQAAVPTEPQVPAAELAALQAELAAAKSDLDAARAEVVAKDAEVSSIRAEQASSPVVEDLSGPLREAEARLRAMTSELEDYQSGAKVAASVSAANEEEMRRQIEEAKAAARAEAEEAAKEELEKTKSILAETQNANVEDPEWSNIKRKYSEASANWVDELVSSRERAESQISTLTKDLDHYKSEYDKINEEAEAMTAEVAKMQLEVENAAASMSVVHATEVGGDGDSKAAREAMRSYQASTSEDEIARKAQEIDRGDLVQLRLGQDDIPAGVYGVIKKRTSDRDLEVRVAVVNCPLLKILGKGLRLKAKRGTFLGIPGAPEEFAALALDDADEVAEELGEELSPRGSRRGSPRAPHIDGMMQTLVTETREDATAMTPRRERKNTKGKTQHEVHSPGRKIVETKDTDYDSMTGRTVASYRQEAEEKRRESTVAMSLAERLKAELASLKQSREEISQKFEALQDAHHELLQKQERAFDEDLTEKCENDVYVFCLWLMRRFLTIREGFAALDENGQGSITLGELVDGLEKHKFITFFAKRVFRKLDVDGSGDLEIREIIDLKEQWALVENERQQISKAEVDAMKEGWSKKEEMLRRYYEEAKKKAAELEQIVKEGGGRGRGRGNGDTVNQEEMKRVQEEAAKVQKNLEKKIAHLETQLSEQSEGYKSLEEKCGKSIWQNRQDLVEMQKLKREKQEVETNMGKLQKKYDALKRAREANQFIEQVMSDQQAVFGAGPAAATGTGSPAPAAHLLPAAPIVDPVTGEQVLPASHLLPVGGPDQQAAFDQFANMLREEGAGIREVSSASLFQKLEGKEVPYRIRNEAISGAKKRWQLLYADAVHRKGTNRSHGVAFASLSPRPGGVRITSPPPLVHELRDAMAGSPHASWSYNFRSFASPSKPELYHAPHRSTNDAPPFSPSKVVSMAGLLQTGDHLIHGKTHHGGFLPKHTRQALNRKRRQQASLSPRRSDSGSPRGESPFSTFASMLAGQNSMPPPGGASRRYLIRTPPQGTSRGGNNIHTSPDSSQTQFFQPAPAQMSTTNLQFPQPPSVISVGPAPSLRTPSVHALSPRRSPSPRPIAGEAVELTDQSAAALLKNFGPASPRRRREGALQVSYEDPMDLYNVAQAYQRSRSHSRIEGTREPSSHHLETPPMSPSASMSPRSARRRSSPRTAKHSQNISMASIPDGRMGPVSKINLSAVNVMDPAPVTQKAVPGHKLGQRRSPSPAVSLSHLGSVEIGDSTSYATLQPPIGVYSSPSLTVTHQGTTGGGPNFITAQSSVNTMLKPNGANNGTTTSSSKAATKSGPQGGGQLHQGRPGARGGHPGESRSRSLSLEFPRVDSVQLISPAKKFQTAPREVVSTTVRTGVRNRSRSPAELQSGGGMANSNNNMTKQSSLSTLAISFDPTSTAAGAQHQQHPQRHGSPMRGPAPVGRRNSRTADSQASNESARKLGQLSADILLRGGGPTTAGNTPHFGTTASANMMMSTRNNTSTERAPVVSGQHFDTRDLPEASATSHSFFASPGKKLGGSYSKPPSTYKVPGGRYIPKKELPGQLAAIEINTTKVVGGNSQHFTSVESITSMGGGDHDLRTNSSGLPWDPRDPPGKNALPVTFAGKKQSSVSPPKKKMPPPMPQLSPFKSVDQWVQDTK
ncbi:unnamed protein product [Amoebophrya sp. A120]|nr:unnamed protein product [Amoebophrya sp. A120]|eukprot:GSA120T00001896001.1